MVSTKRTLLFHTGIAILVGIFLATFLGFDGKPDPESRARELVPDELTAGKMIIGHFGRQNGAASFVIEGPIPTSMQSLEPRLHFGFGRTPSRTVTAVPWIETASNQRYSHESGLSCSCFACAENVRICEMAADWLNKKGSLFYVNADPQGTSYILNREGRRLIVVWNRPL